jgi:hypothetical protein
MTAIIKFFSANFGTIAVLLILLAVLALIAVRIIKNKKKGVSSCGCGCSTCPYSGKCHGAEKNDSEQ